MPIFEGDCWESVGGHELGHRFEKGRCERYASSEGPFLVLALFASKVLEWLRLRMPTGTKVPYIVSSGWIRKTGLRIKSGTPSIMMQPHRAIPHKVIRMDSSMPASISRVP
jgi:hypothetical protein